MRVCMIWGNIDELILFDIWGYTCVGIERAVRVPVSLHENYRRIPFLCTRARETVRGHVHVCVFKRVCTPERGSTRIRKRKKDTV